MELEDFDYYSPILSQKDSGLKSPRTSRPQTEAWEHWQQRTRLIQEALVQETKRNDKLERENATLVKENHRLRKEIAGNFDFPSTSSPVSVSCVSAPVPDIEKYLSFALSVIENAPDLRMLLIGRVHSLDSLVKYYKQAQWTDLCLKLTQVMCDFVVYYTHKEQKSDGNTQETAQKQDYGVKFDNISSRPVAIRPISPSNPSDFTRFYEEHRSLLSSLSTQSDRLSRLNQQLTATMASSKRLLSQRPDRSSTSSPKPTGFELIPGISVVPQVSGSTSPLVTEAFAAETQTDAADKGLKMPVYRTKSPGSKKVQPMSRAKERATGFRETGWTSVGEFFKSGDREKSLT